MKKITRKSFLKGLLSLPLAVVLGGTAVKAMAEKEVVPTTADPKTTSHPRLDTFRYLVESDGNITIRDYLEQEKIYMKQRRKSAQVLYSILRKG